jgi:hypothetical protein
VPSMVGALLALCLSCRLGVAGVSASGTPEGIVLRADGATMVEVAAALRADCNVDVVLIGTTSRRISGVYHGSLRLVLSRLLAGENYIIGAIPGGVRIILSKPGAALAVAASSEIGASGDDAAPVPIPAPSRLIGLRQARLKARGVTSPNE